MTERVAKFSVDRPEDIFVLRQGGRVAAAAIGCDEADQVRLATALSELGREALAHGGGSTVTLSLDADSSLVVDIEDFPPAVTSTSASMGGLDAARKLIGDVTVGGTMRSERISLRLRHGHPAVEKNVTAAAVSTALERTAKRGPLDELRLENRNLIATLGALRERQDQLVRLNAELEETNRGVMAMYTQLADELDETNRGVVALYAELDDKTVRLNEASEAKSRFLASVSHELRSPLNSILGLAKLLLDPAPDTSPDEARKQLRLIVSSGGELLELVNGLLDLAKAESGRLQPSVTRVELADVFAELRGSLRPMVRPGVEFVVDLADEPVIETDRVLLVHVLRNLLSNALKFTPSGRVCLSAHPVGAYEIELRVSDTGIGIAPEDQTRVFDEFFQVRGPLQADHKGTGLGLAYARRVTHTLGGQLRLETELGRGSEFTVKLPLRWQTPPTAGHPPSSRGGVPASGTVLIVDDDAGFRTALRGMLHGLAHQVLEAHGGVEALAAMRAAAPDLVFLDLRMPDLDGIDVLAAMSADPALRDIPVVVVTCSDLAREDGTLLERATLRLSKESVTPERLQEMFARTLGSPDGGRAT